MERRGDAEAKKGVLSFGFGARGCFDGRLQFGVPLRFGSGLCFLDHVIVPPAVGYVGGRNPRGQLP